MIHGKDSTSVVAGAYTVFSGLAIKMYTVYYSYNIYRFFTSIQTSRKNISVHATLRTTHLLYTWNTKQKSYLKRLMSISAAISQIQFCICRVPTCLAGLEICCQFMSMPFILNCVTIGSDQTDESVFRHQSVLPCPDRGEMEEE